MTAHEPPCRVYGEHGHIKKVPFLVATRTETPVHCTLNHPHMQAQSRKIQPLFMLCCSMDLLFTLHIIVRQESDRELKEKALPAMAAYIHFTGG